MKTPVYKILLRKALDEGYRLSIFDGEEDINVDTFEQAEEVIKSVEESYINIHERYDVSRTQQGFMCWAQVIWGWDMEPDDTIADYSLGRDDVPLTDPTNYIERFTQWYENASPDELKSFSDPE